MPETIKTATLSKPLFTTIIRIAFAGSAIFFAVLLAVFPIKAGWSETPTSLYFALCHMELLMLYGLYRQFHCSGAPLREVLIFMTPLIWVFLRR